MRRRSGLSEQQEAEVDRKLRAAFAEENHEGPGEAQRALEVLRSRSAGRRRAGRPAGARQRRVGWLAPAGVALAVLVIALVAVLPRALSHGDRGGAGNVAPLAGGLKPGDPSEPTRLFLADGVNATFSLVRGATTSRASSSGDTCVLSVPARLNLTGDQRAFQSVADGVGGRYPFPAGSRATSGTSEIDVALPATFPASSVSSTWLVTWVFTVTYARLPGATGHAPPTYSDYSLTLSMAPHCTVNALAADAKEDFMTGGPGGANPNRVEVQPVGGTPGKKAVATYPSAASSPS